MSCSVVSTPWSTSEREYASMRSLVARSELLELVELLLEVRLAVLEQPDPRISFGR